MKAGKGKTEFHTIFVYASFSLLLSHFSYRGQMATLNKVSINHSSFLNTAQVFNESLIFSTIAPFLNYYWKHTWEGFPLTLSQQYHRKRQPLSKLHFRFNCHRKKLVNVGGDDKQKLVRQRTDNTFKAFEGISFKTKRMGDVLALVPDQDVSTHTAFIQQFVIPTSNCSSLEFPCLNLFICCIILCISNAIFIYQNT